MKKILFAAAALAALSILPSCAKEVNYSDYISELRYKVYLYEDDDIKVKVNLTSRESPYLSDGYKGDMQDMCEIFIKFAQSPDEVSVRLGESGGEMSYMSVTDSFYISFAAGEMGDSAALTLDCDGEEREITAPSALYSGVISPEQALDSARQYDGETFSALTDGNNFKGEIYVRLLSDEGRCYYYVGVTDREGNTSAYLIDGENGNVLAERKQ